MTGIEWTDRTWNPVTGCTPVSEGCDHCYAQTFAERWRGVPGHPYQGGFDLTLRPGRLLDPLRWRTPAKVFTSMTDLFHDGVPDAYLARVFAVMGLATRHTFQVLTKRHARARALLTQPGFHHQVAEQASDIIGRGIRIRLDLTGWTPLPGTRPTVWSPPWPLPNVWLGVSAEDQHWASIRIPALLATPAAVRFVSAEPLLGPLELGDWVRPVPGCRYANPDDGCCAHPRAATPECFRGADCPVSPDAYHGLDWLIVGGESGPGARPLDLAWVQQLVDYAEAEVLPVYVKQLGAVWARTHGGPVKGGDPGRWPPQLRVRQFPTGRFPTGRGDRGRALPHIPTRTGAAPA